MDNDQTTVPMSSGDYNMVDKQCDPGIADESDADDRDTDDKQSDDKQSDDKVAEGHWKSTTDGSGTSETD